MPDNRLPTLLLTRPRPQSLAFLALCEARAGQPLPHHIAPVITISDVPVADLGPPGASLIFTSVHAVARAGTGEGRTAFCVGDRTAEAARVAGFDAHSAAGDAAALIALIRDARPEGPLTYLRGAHAAADIAGALRAAGFATEARIVYRQDPVGLAPPDLAALGDEPHFLAPVFSPLSARTLSGSLGALGERAHVISISQSVRTAWEGPVASNVVARAPNAEAMADCVAQLALPSAC
ncbi:MAG: uroporphyrinogen-III synthase [Pseudomonadota bacterium]